MITLSKYTQLNAINDIFAPRYHDKKVIIAISKIKRSKLPIKLHFSKVNDTDEWAGDWYLPRAQALKHKTFNNNGLMCVEINMSEFQKIQLINREDL